MGLRANHRVQCNLVDPAIAARYKENISARLTTTVERILAERIYGVGDIGDKTTQWQRPLLQV
jgi:hypothetical protein